ncbi:MAG: prepilin-type N-terminal cleavage/methylation domain-containing protein [Candidatus Omnitrophota bacterium]|jgi:prepilin-type N-terminal cleavage/methylation domain-containing protein
MTRLKKAFTLLELVIVIVVVGVLATLGLQSYQVTIEKSRGAEAKANLGLLRKLQFGYYLEYNKYSSGGIITDLGLPAGIGYDCSASGEEYYFKYRCSTTGTCYAYRCTTGGKPPSSSTGYVIYLSTAGVWSGTAGYY